MQEEHASRLKEAHILTETLRNEAEQRVLELKSQTDALKAAHDDIAHKTDQLQTVNSDSGENGSINFSFFLTF